MGGQENGNLLRYRWLFIAFDDCHEYLRAANKKDTTIMVQLGVLGNPG
ncbi:hypothetical protein Cpin_4738 [Chitinophaga pinensis DSM 2588]|uniref:Uncharacterized protein n=1 Tax=Chitinophaga pinensis (strain ATCC 43595 / DSM 2588 / LMG 13176 / NBRC 15968 / NCIMB 11800 / UQM 2034) TaxID=485918 RepID=A0A979G779_CHIPD|nr:hypothetical protein Cpin_4738 [Chitinophaga pinensis DSM 2588]